MACAAAGAGRAAATHEQQAMHAIARRIVMNRTDRSGPECMRRSLQQTAVTIEQAVRRYTMRMLTARRFVLSGRVQGVGFRFFARQAARIEGLSGWVQNRPDGRVEVVAEGEAESMQRFEARLRQGPPGARVDAVRVDDEPPSGRPGEFVIHP
jgi:acylphosphatase